MFRLLALSYRGYGREDWPILALGSGKKYYVPVIGRDEYELTPLMRRRWARWHDECRGMTRNRSPRQFGFCVSLPPDPNQDDLWRGVQAEMRAAIPRGVCKMSRSGQRVIFIEPICGRRDWFSLEQLRLAGIPPWGSPSEIAPDPDCPI